MPIGGNERIGSVQLRCLSQIKVSGCRDHTRHLVQGSGCSSDDLHERKIVIAERVGTHDHGLGQGPLAAGPFLQQISADLVIWFAGEIRRGGERVVQSTDSYEREHEHDKPGRNNPPRMTSAGSGQNHGRNEFHWALLHD